jgi:hypothetical protein
MTVGKAKFIIERVFGYSKFVQLAMVMFVTYKTSGISFGEGAVWLVAGTIAMVIIGVLDLKYIYKEESLASAKHSLEKLVELMKEKK